jgi:MraZ protein
MAAKAELILGEHLRTLDERFRVTLPESLVSGLGKGPLVLAKERPGCLSLWSAAVWQQSLDRGTDLVRAKIDAGRLQGKLHQVQALGRLLSTRHARVDPDAKSRLLIPEGFREFLQVEAGGEVLLVGAAVCVELWNPQTWRTYLERAMPRFRKLFDRLTR